MARSHGDPRARNDVVGPTPTSLGGVVATVNVIDLVCAPRGVDVPVTETVIHDPASPPPFGAGALVMGVGVPGRSSDAIELVTRAGASGAAGVALKFTAAPTAKLRKAAESA